MAESIDSSYGRHALVEHDDQLATVPRRVAQGRHRMEPPIRRYPDTPPIPISSIMVALTGVASLQGHSEAPGKFVPPAAPVEAPSPGHLEPVIMGPQAEATALDDTVNFDAATAVAEALKH